MSIDLGVAENPYDAQKITRLRSLAAWYRAFADKADAPWIWEARLLRAKELDLEADLLVANQRSTLRLK